MAADFEAYFRALAATAVDEKTEHMDRGALQLLLQAAADDAGPGSQVLHEPRRDKGGAGSPDFKVGRQGRIAGYIEVKAVDENLSKVLRSEQIKKYRTLSGNIILTDYLEFVWIRGDGEVVRQRLAHSEDLAGRTLRLKPEAVEAVRLLLRGFFTTAPQQIAKSRDLALALASRAAMLRDFLALELQRQAKEHTEGRLHALFDVFRKQVFHELKIPEFADAFAQMLAYGLFLARLNAGERDMVTLTNVREHVPGSFSLIRELVRFLDDMNDDEYRDIRWVIDEILSIVNGLDLAAIHKDLSFRSRKAISRKVRAADEEEHRLFERDPFIYFYEDFLKAYDPAMRKGRGVYYTPPPVVNFIIRAVDDILKDTFGIRDGLADHRKVTVLDFACGTGTFLLEVFERVFDNIGGPEAGRADQIVREHLAKNIYGFEYLIASYTVAHLKLSQYLRDKGHPLEEGERLQVFLTNTLEPVEPQGNLLLPALAEEVKGAQAVKDKPILVITGNPPYSGHSKNKGEWISAAIDGYKFTVEAGPDGREEKRPLGERNPKWLNDDYVKFIRFAQMKMDEVEEGVVGIITNHSWLDNPTFRGMRQSLMRTFDQIYVLDLHGNRKKKERAPGGLRDENVFDIEQGVAISLFIKGRDIERGVWRGDLWGRRLEKYQSLTEQYLSDAEFKRIVPSAPNYLLLHQDADNLTDYEEGWALPDIFAAGSVGIMTGRDSLAVNFDRREMFAAIRRFASMPPEEARRLFALGSDVRDWRVEWAQQDLNDTRITDGGARQMMYRPFDVRWTYYTGKSRGFHCYPRDGASRQMLSGDNISLLSARSNKSDRADHVFVSSMLSEAKTAESTTQSYFYPLRVEGRENLSPDLRRFLDDRYDHHYGPEEILGYAYAVLHAPAFRQRYAEFLRIDFPRIPFAETKARFDALSKLGWELVQAHLLKAVPRPASGRLADYRGKGDHTVEFVRYSPEDQTIAINATQGFAPVPQAVWDFRIGGYQVLDKYLKSRKGRQLNLDEQTHVGEVAEALAFTIAQMEKIDATYLAAFPDGDNSNDPARESEAPTAH